MVSIDKIASSIPTSTLDREDAPIPYQDEAVFVPSKKLVVFVSSTELCKIEVAAATCCFVSREFSSVDERTVPAICETISSFQFINDGKSLLSEKYT